VRGVVLCEVIAAIKEVPQDAGAGKTRATEEVLREYPHAVTQIVGDDLRAFHPAYEHLLTNAPALMPDATAQASGAWVRMSIDYALENRHSIIVEGTFRRPDVTMSEARHFHDAGFSTHVVALAVPAPVSRLSTLQRYADGIRQSGQARWTPLEAHEAGFEGTPRTVAAAEHSLTSTASASTPVPVPRSSTSGGQRPDSPARHPRSRSGDSLRWAPRPRSFGSAISTTTSPTSETEANSTRACCRCSANSRSTPATSSPPLIPTREAAAAATQPDSSLSNAKRKTRNTATRAVRPGPPQR
jgi:hypothetical protein